MSSINIQAQACVACEGRPSPENTRCAVCGAGQPAASAEPVAWFIDWPDEPDLGHCLAEAPVDGARCRALVFHDAAPVAAQAQQEADKTDAERYRAWRDARITGRTSEHDFIRLAAGSLSTSVGMSRRTTAAEWDAAIDAACKGTGQ